MATSFMHEASPAKAAGAKAEGTINLPEALLSSNK